MLKKAAILTLIILHSTLAWKLSAQPAERSISKFQYVDMWKDVAIQHMYEYGIPASITLAQGILESGHGNSALAKYANNHFGIKCHDWNGEGFYKDDDAKNECFRRYYSAEESFKDHALFLKNRSRYDFLFDYNTTDYESWAKGLKKAGYATNPEYAKLLIKIIEDNDLDQYDRMETIPNRKTQPNNKSVSDFPLTANLNKHQVYQHKTKRSYIKVEAGDTYYKIAQEFEMGMWQLYKYNDLGKRDVLIPGEFIYLQPKKNKSVKGNDYYRAKNETLRQISQSEGIKLKKLSRLNPGIEPDENINNLKIKLR